MGMDTPGRAFPPFASEAEVLALVEAFREHTLPLARWTHQAHLAVGLWHVESFGEEAAKPALRQAIRAYNEAVGTPNSDTRGYHETVTLYFVWSAARFLDTRPGGGLIDRVNAYVEGPFGAKDGVFAFWSRERLLSVAARHGWLAPDLQPLHPGRLGLTLPTA